MASRQDLFCPDGLEADTGLPAVSSRLLEPGRPTRGYYNGITGVQQDRPDSTPPAHLLDDFHVHDNLICATHGEHPVGVVADNGDNLAERNISFTCNTIQSAACPLSLTSVMGSPCCHEHRRTTWRCY
jgi:hypothetical protein